MIDIHAPAPAPALSISLAPRVARPAAEYNAAVSSPPPTGELSDDDLEQVVGGLARVWMAADAAPRFPAPDTAVSLPTATELPHRISA